MQGYKVCIVGSLGAGKTSICGCLKNERVSHTHHPTIGATFFELNQEADGRAIRLYFWDTSGNMAFRPLLVKFIHQSRAIIVVFDVTEEESFAQVRPLISTSRQVVQDPVVLICGNKIDLEQDRVVPTEQGRNLARELHATYFEVSAFTKEGIPNLLTGLVNELMNRPLDMEEVQIDEEMDVEEPGPETGSSYCSCCFRTR